MANEYGFFLCFVCFSLSYAVWQRRFHAHANIEAMLKMPRCGVAACRATINPDAVFGRFSSCQGSEVFFVHPTRDAAPTRDDKSAAADPNTS